LIQGFRYAFGTPAIRSILLLLGLVSLLAMPYAVLLPIMAGRIYHGGAHTLGFLMGAAGLGGLAGALALAGGRSIEDLIRSIPFSAAAFGALLILLALQPPWWLALVWLFAIGWCGIHLMAGSNTVLQTLVDENQRGRVMSYYTMAMLGVGPLGNLLAGGLAQWLGVAAALAVCGAACIAATLALGRGIWRIKPRGAS
jgi:MFS family permease